MHKLESVLESEKDKILWDRKRITQSRPKYQT